MAYITRDAKKTLELVQSQLNTIHDIEKRAISRCVERYLEEFPEKREVVYSGDVWCWGINHEYIRIIADWEVEKYNLKWSIMSPIFQKAMGCDSLGTTTQMTRDKRALEKIRQLIDSNPESQTVFLNPEEQHLLEKDFEFVSRVDEITEETREELRRKEEEMERESKERYVKALNNQPPKSLWKLIFG